MKLAATVKWFYLINPETKLISSLFLPHIFRFFPEESDLIIRNSPSQQNVGKLGTSTERIFTKVEIDTPEYNESSTV
jgi:hypothetical protein